MSILIRKPTEDDLARFKECLCADSDHRMQDMESWTAPSGEFMVFYDAKGNRVWVRVERVLRVHFQHDPDTPRKDLIFLIYKGMSFLVGSAKRNELCEVIFESRAPRLIQFLKKLFGFTPLEANYSVRAK